MIKIQYILSVILFIILVTSVTAIPQKTISLNVQVNSNDTARIEELKVYYGEPDTKDSSVGDYTHAFKDSQGRTIWSKSTQYSFRAYPLLIDPNQNENEIVIQEYIFDQMLLPTDLDIKTYELSHNGKIIFRADIGHLLCNNNNRCDNNENYLSCPADCGDGSEDGYCNKVVDAVCDGDCNPGDDADCTNEPRQGSCGNNVCQSSETYATCPQDCPSGSADKYCDGVLDGICDPDCRAVRDPDCPQGPTGTNTPSGQGPNYILWLSLLIAVGLVMAGIVLFMRSKRPPQQAQVNQQANFQRMQNYYPPGSMPGRYRMPPRQ